MIVRLTLAYDGTDFSGWARQRDRRTVQGELEAALSRVLRARVRVAAAGRTDARVHARGQVVSFEAPPGTDPARLQRAVNGMLAPEVVVGDARRARDGFHARFSATAREYRYRMDIGPWPDPFDARFVWHRPGELAITPMRQAARSLLGEHDFASFCRRPEAGGTVRTLERLTVSRRHNRVEITARANAFLHQMVRSLVGTLVAVGAGRVAPGSMRELLASKDRRAAGPIAPPHGLTLERVIYRRRPAV